MKEMNYNERFMITGAVVVNMLYVPAELILQYKPHENIENQDSFIRALVGEGIATLNYIATEGEYEAYSLTQRLSQIKGHKGMVPWDANGQIVVLVDGKYYID
jgi:hypothetical protein